MRRRFFAGLLCLGMALALLPLPALAAGGRAIQMGTDGIRAGDKIYFGKFTYSGADYDVPWHVLSDGIFTQSNVPDATAVLPLLSEYLLWKSKFQESASGSYPGSTLQTTMNTIYNGFDSKEQSAIQDTTLRQDSMHSSVVGDLAGQKLFPLSHAEAIAWGGPADQVSSIRTAYYIHDLSDDDKWWLRTSFDTTQARMVMEDGKSNYVNAVTGNLGVRPAFHLKKDAVLFISAAADGKAGDGTLAAVGTNGTDKWKLTLNDSANRASFAVTTTAVSAPAGCSVRVDYSGAIVGNKEYLSAMLVNAGNEILYYGRLKAIASAADAAGTAAVTIPAGLAQGSYTLKIFNEQYNGANKTDYASAFTNVALTVIAPLQLTVTGTTASDKVYDGNTDAAVTLGTVAGVATGDDVTVHAAGTFNDENAGVGKTVTVTYSLSGTDAAKYIAPANDMLNNKTINAKALAVTGTTADDKIYDGNTAAAVHLGTVTGVVIGDDVTVSAAGSFRDAGIGANKPVDITYTLSGSDATNYTRPANGTATASITAAPAYAIALESPVGTPLTAHAFPAQSAGYNPRNVPPLTVTVKNTGNQPTGDLAIGLSGGDPGAFSLSVTTLPSIAAGGTGSFEVAVVGGFAPSTYNAAVTVSAAPGNPNSITPKDFTVAFTVDNLPTVAAPTFNPAGGTYNSAQSVTLSCATLGAVIRYTTDGTEPTASSAVYSAPISVTVTTTVKAKAFKAGMNDSAMASATYTINTPGPVPPAPSSGSSSISGGGAYVGNQYAGSFTIGANGSPIITVQAPCASLISVIVDGAQLSQNTHYSVTCGSTVITFTPAYLSTLKDGAHTIRVQFTDGRYDGTFTTPLSASIAAVPVPDVPATGAPAACGAALYAVLLLGVVLAESLHRLQG